MIRVLDLFSGIGGFSLGLERAGMKTVAFCEIEPFCRRVLAKHWPGVPCYDDVRTLTAARLHDDGIAVDVICGGFPCQDISVAGKGAGLAGERSGLWSEYARLIGEIRPRYVIVENVAALLGRGLGDVLGDLSALGYDAEWHCIPASAVGAPHRRDRVWIVAYPNGDGWQQVGCDVASDPEAHGAGPGNRSCDAGSALAHPDSEWKSQSQGRVGNKRGWVGDGSEDMADAAGDRWPWRERPIIARSEFSERCEAIGEWWRVEPDVGRVAHGIPARVDRLRGLGNAVVPQIPELIGRCIIAVESRSNG